MLERNQIELLAPAGDEECFKAAIAAGANAIYFGLEKFNARKRAKNITVDQAMYLIPLAHKNHCRTYLTLNTLITDQEINSALSLVQDAISCGIDGVIVQDLGILQVLHKSFPQLELHASTQMTTHNLSQCEFLSELGVSQINLSRELSLTEIQKITEFLHSKNIIPEIFVQGAFCISYSGQCYLSGNLYNEAGNRGACVQPCRRNWNVKTDNHNSPKDFKPLFHLKDNSAFSIADKLIKQNIPLSLKIEGRIKNAEYVWAVTSAWREQIDLILAEKPILKSSPKLTGAINRDYTCGYLEGNINSQMFSNGEKDFSQIKAGTVKNYIADTKTLILYNDDNNLKKGDRLTIKTTSDQFICTADVKEKKSQGYVIQITNKLTKKILNGQTVYKSTSVINSEKLAKILDKICPKNSNSNKCSTNTAIKTNVDIFVESKENQPIEISYCYKNHKITVKSEKPLEKAQNAGLTAQTLEEKLSKLGGTNFAVNHFEIKVLEPNLFIPLAELNNLRRKAIDLLEKELNSISEKQIPSEIEKLTYTNKTINNSKDAFLIDNLKDLEQLLEEKSVTKNDFKIIYELPSAINIVENQLFNMLNQKPDVVLYFNSILMEQDLENTINFIKCFDSIKEREILCENTGLAYELKKIGCKIILGPNCNIYNSWNIQKYCEILSPFGIIPSLELNSSQTEELKFPENIQIWYPKKLYNLLMQSRQCLVRNGSGCAKTQVDRNCFENCSKKILLDGTQGEEIFAVKRPGFYSALYTAQAINFNYSKKFENKVSVWIIDKRKISNK